MPLNDKQRQAIVDWLGTKATVPHCPGCGQLGPFSLGEILAPATFDLTNKTILVGTTVPLVPVICTNCGNVRLFSAVMMGIVPESDGGS